MPFHRNLKPLLGYQLMIHMKKMIQVEKLGALGYRTKWTLLCSKDELGKMITCLTVSATKSLHVRGWRNTTWVLPKQVWRSWWCCCKSAAKNCTALPNREGTLSRVYIAVIQNETFILTSLAALNWNGMLFGNQFGSTGSPSPSPSSCDLPVLPSCKMWQSCLLGVAEELTNLSVSSCDVTGKGFISCFPSLPCHWTQLYYLFCTEGPRDRKSVV